MKKIIILAMLCVFSVASIQSVEAKSIDSHHNGKDVSKIERKADFKKYDKKINNRNHKFVKKDNHKQDIHKNNKKIAQYNHKKHEKIHKQNRHSKMNHNKKHNNFKKMKKHDGKRSFHK